LQAHCVTLFKLYRGQLIVETMAAFYVVEHLDVIKHITSSIFPRGVDFSLDPFPFQKLEKALGHGVVMTVASALMLATKLFAFKKLRQSELLYWLPWSE